MPFLSPGAGAVNALNQWMAARVAQQADADRLALEQQQEARTASYQQELLDLQRKQADATLSERKRTSFLKDVENMMPGDIPTAAQIQTAKELGLEHMFGTRQQALPQSVADLAGTGPDVETLSGRKLGAPAAVATPQPLTFKGTPVQREQQRRDDLLTELMTAMPPGPKQEAVAFRLATGNNPPAGFFDQAETAGMFWQDPRGGTIKRLVDGKWVDWAGDLPKGAHVMTKPEPPNANDLSSGADVLTNTQYGLILRSKLAELQRRGVSLDDAVQQGLVAPISAPLQGQTRAMMEGAQMIYPHITELRDWATELDKRGMFGPIMSRVTGLMTQIGTTAPFTGLVESDNDSGWTKLGQVLESGADPQLAALSNDELAGAFVSMLGYMATGAGRVHGGARGGGSTTMLEHFKSLLSPNATLPVFRGRIKTLQSIVGSYAKGPTGADVVGAEPEAGGPPPAGGAAPRTRPSAVDFLNAR